MQIKKVKMTEIEEYYLNSKIHTDEQVKQIAKSIQEFGYNDLIAVDEDGVIIEGHGRFQALQLLGYEDVDVLVLEHMTTEQKNAYRIIHNKLNMNTDFDLGLLKEEMESIIGIDMLSLGFSAKELDELSRLESQLETDTPQPKGRLICPHCGHVDERGEFRQI